VTLDLGAPVGHPPFKVLPYRAVSEECGAWEKSYPPHFNCVMQDSGTVMASSDFAENSSPHSSLLLLPAPFGNIIGHSADPVYCQPPKPSSRVSSSKLARPARRKLNIDGGRPAVAKKVTPDLDSDDELFVRMKNAEYLEKDIAATLAKEDRINYHPKTIGTRWARIKRMLQRVQDQMLDNKLTD